MIEALAPSLVMLFAGILTIALWRSLLKLVLGMLSIELSVLLAAAVLLSDVPAAQWALVALALILSSSEAVLVAFVISLSRRYRIEDLDELSSLRG
ncbi:MAG: hypothetical protein ABWK00_06770 [Desulfurococcaceae archaeon]